MAAEMQAAYAEYVKAQQAREIERPKALQELDARLARLRDMQRGSPDMADELQAAVERAESKRRELEAQEPAVKQSARVLSIVPKAAELYRRQIALGLDGDPRAALEARVALRELFVGGRVDLQREQDGSVWAVGQIQPGALIRQAVAVGNGGSGGALRRLFAAHPASIQNMTFSGNPFWGAFLALHIHPSSASSLRRRSLTARTLRPPMHHACFLLEGPVCAYIVR